MEEKAYTVYVHISPNNKKYIGITSRKPIDRWQNGQGYKKNKFFYNCIKKYGWENIKHKILFEKLTKEEAEKKEKELIAFYKSNEREFGYNLSIGGDFSTKGLHCNLGIKRSEEQKEKIRKAKLGKMGGKDNPMYGRKGKLSPCFGKRKTEEQRKKLSKSIYQFSCDGILIKKWFGIREAERNLKIDSASIVKCCQKQTNHKTTGGFIFSYDENINIEDYLDKKKKKVIQMNELKEPIKVWNSGVEVCSFFSIKKGTLSNACKLQKKIKGYYWRYENE